MSNQAIDIKLIDVAARAAYERDRAFLSVCGAKPPEAWGGLEEWERWQLRDLVKAVMIGVESRGPRKPAGAEQLVMPEPLQLCGSDPSQAFDRWGAFCRVVLAEKDDYEASRAAYLARHGGGSGAKASGATA